MSILSIPPYELLRLWTELEEARHGTNGFGGNTAELYAYRFGCMGPSYSMDSASAAESDRKSGLALHALLDLFLEHHPGISLEVDGSGFGAWMARPFRHRVHVTVSVPPDGHEARIGRALRHIDLARALHEAADRICKMCLDPEDSDVRRFRALADRAIP